MSRFDDLKQDTLVERVIAASARNKFLIVIFTVFAVAAGVYGLLHTSLDAIEWWF
jgi:copper/silver efflux system protein